MNVNPAKITEARQVRGLNISQLAQQAGLSRQSISLYELGERNPGAEALICLSNCLGFPVEFFLDGRVSASYEGALFFRSLKTAEASSRTAVIRKCGWLRDVYDYLEQFLSLPELEMPVTDFVLRNNESITFEEIDSLTDLVRNQWELGSGPIPKMLPLLEQKGFIVTGATVPGEKVDACSVFDRGRPTVFLGDSPTTSGSHFRQNFTLAHELGHMVMHQYITAEDMQVKDVRDRIEKEADYFASSLLMPRDSFLRDVHSTSLAFLLGLKRKWNVSVAAMIYRCSDLGLLTEQEKTNLYKHLSFKRWRKSEPYDDETPKQKATVFKVGFDLLLEKSVVSKYDIVSHFKWPTADIEDLCSLPSGYFTRDEAPKLKLI